jgi:hypothetical protein
MFLHIFYTWLLANLLHPVMFFLAALIMREAPGFDQNLFEIVLLLLAYSLCLSAPCLLLGWLCLYLIICSPYSGDARFVLWLVSAVLLIVLEFLFILLAGDILDLEFLLYSLPGVAAVGTSILIRYRQFKKLIHIPKINNHETNLV